MGAASAAINAYSMPFAAKPFQNRIDESRLKITGFGEPVWLGVWCPGPESNRHGVSTEGFSYQLQFLLLRLKSGAFVVWTFSLPYHCGAQ